MRRSIIAALVFLLLACEKEKISIGELNLSNAELTYEIAIDGFISTEMTRCQVTLSEPVSISDSVHYIPVTDAEVTLTDGSNAYLFELIDSSGIYASYDSIAGTIGNTYTLEVSYNGKSYTASDIMPVADEVFNFPVNEIESFPDEDRIEFSVLEHNFGYEKPLVWSFVQGYFGENNEFQLPFYDVYDLYSMRIYSHVGSIPQGLFPNGFNVTGASGISSESLEIIKMAISDQYYEYLLSLFNETDWKAGIFSTIAGNVKTNISKGGIGYFYATNVKRKRITYNDL
jgi:hypothetical protein